MKLFFVKPEGGLANRLMALISAMRVAKMTAYRLIVIWKLDDNCNAPLSVLFPGAFEECREEDIPSDVFFSTETDGLIPFLPMSVFTSGQDVYSVQHHFFYTELDCWHLHHNKLYLAEQLSALFRSLPVDEYVRQHASRYENMPDLALGLHIRRPVYTDTGNHLVTKRWMAPSDQDYVRLLTLIKEQMNIRGKIYLSTNSLESRQTMISAFGNDIIFHDATSLEQNGGNFAIMDALIDMIALSHCPIIVRRYPSTFAYFASVVGLKESFVVYRQDEDLDDPNKKAVVAVRSPLNF